MASFRLLPLFFALAGMGWSAVMAEDAMSGAVSGIVREPRSPNRQKKLCRKYGICQGFGGFQGGYQGYQGGYQGYQGGYQGGYEQQGYPPINIAISQSQSSANHGGDGYAQGYYPNNYQYNGGYPNQGYNHNQGYGGYEGYGGYQKPGYFGNGQGAYNNQFNGNYYGGQPNGGGYGFQGGFYDEVEHDEVQKTEQDGNNPNNDPGTYNNYQGRSNTGGQTDGSYAAAGSTAFAAAS